MPSATLPPPEPFALEHSERVLSHIRTQIESANGWISFARYMELALYAPLLGYYSAGAHKLGAGGDFVTAPELTPLFGQALAKPVAGLMQASRPSILELGAGSGQLAADLMTELLHRQQLPEQYAILDLSGDLRERQQTTLRARLPALFDRFVWLDQLPPEFAGVVIANEVLDAMPVHLVSWQGSGISERGVGFDSAGALQWAEHDACGPVLEAASRLPVSPPYVSEINLAATAWIKAWSERLEQGALLLIDYGFPRVEYYHPQRNQGTLMCHYRHRAHSDPLWLPGLNDITAHVDFTAVAEAGVEGGLALGGYTSQASFLMNCGLLELLERCGDSNSVAYIKAAAAVQKLISPAEMGEMFKVMLLTRGIDSPIAGFGRGDRSHTL